MKQVTFESLYIALSKARISPYLSEGCSAEHVLDKYNANIILSEAMIPILHYFEICFRNRIDQAISEYYSQDWLINLPHKLMISEQDVRKINDIVSRVKRENNRDPLHDDIVAQMTFGFWCSFFHRKYDPLIWHLKDAMRIMFPYLPRVNRKRSYVESSILQIKSVRNRIAHHEPVWNRKTSIIDAYTTCNYLIHSMSQEAAQMLKAVDRFPLVYKKVTDELRSVL